MKLANMLGERFRETPADCQIASQIFMIRGGYMKQVANGIYTLLMPAKRITRKIENIMREEMDAIDGQEVMFPVVMPGDLWRESGRFDAIGSELLRMKDRGGNEDSDHFSIDRFCRRFAFDYTIHSFYVLARKHYFLFASG